MNCLVKMMVLAVVFCAPVTICVAGKNKGKGNAALTKQLREEYGEFCEKLSAFNGQLASFDWFIVCEKDFPLLYDMVKELSAKMDITMPVIQIYKGSQVSQNLSYYIGGTMRGNAWAMQLSPEDNGTINIGESLITDPICGLQYDELRAVVAHELAHIKHAHCPTRQAKSRQVAVVVASALMLIYRYSYNVYGYFNIENKPWALGGMINTYRIMNLAALDMVSRPAVWLLYKFCREQEVEADQTSICVSNNPLALARGIEKITKMARRHDNIFNVIKNNWESCSATHPTLTDREKYCEAAAEQKSVQASAA